MKKRFPIFLLGLLLVFTTAVFARQTENGFELYERGEYAKAAEILQKAVAADAADKKSWLYLGMSYIRLNEKKQAVKALEKADGIEIGEPPKNETAVKIISKSRASYTDDARMNGIQGTVKLAVEFGADGEIKYIFGFKGLPFGLTENCVKAVSKIKFEPATRDGKPVSSVAIVKYSFAIY